MHIFVDESGTHKQADHSTVALVCVEVDDLENLEKAILAAEHTLGTDAFHWSRQRWKFREVFLRKLLSMSFAVKVAIFVNPFQEKRDFTFALRHLIAERNITALIIDGKKTKWYERKLKAVLREKGITVRKLRTVSDESSPGIRLADAMAGLCCSYFDNPDGPAKSLFELYRNKITTLSGGQATK